jgi:hypothetical protein
VFFINSEILEGGGPRRRSKIANFARVNEKV